MTTLKRRILRSFLGPRNFKGLYYKNPLAFPPTHAKYDKSKNYISAYPVRASDRIDRAGRVKWQQVFENGQQKRPRNTLAPFPENEYCRSAQIIPETMKKAIVAEHDSGESVQRLSFKYGLALPRVQAIIDLARVEKNLAEEGKITRELKKFDRTMRSMFTVLRVDNNEVPLNPRDNLTEIPVPKETNQQRFLSIAESEPFGPVDAAKVLGIEPAAQTLENLTQHSVEDETADKLKSDQTVAFYGPQYEGEKAVFRFTSVKVGEVGYRYGASRDDRRHARRIRFDEVGRMHYA